MKRMITRNKRRTVTLASMLLVSLFSSNVYAQQDVERDKKIAENTEAIRLINNNIESTDTYVENLREAMTAFSAALVGPETNPTDSSDRIALWKEITDRGNSIADVVVKNAKGINGNKTRLDGMILAIDQHGREIADVKADISDHANKIADNTASITSNSARIDDVVSAVDQRGREIADVKADIADHTNQLDRHDGEILANRNAIGGNEMRINAHENRLNGAEGDIDRHDSEIRANRNAIGENEMRINAHENRLNSAEDDIDRHDGEIRTNRNAIGGNEMRINAHENRLNSAEGDIERHDGEIRANRNAIDSNEMRINIHENRLNMNDFKLTDHDNRIQNNTLKIGQLDGRISSLNKEMKRGFAAQAALTGLFQPYNVQKLNVSVAMGGYKSETAVAIGSGYRFNERVAAKAGIAVGSGGDVSYNVGVNFEW